MPSSICLISYGKRQVLCGVECCLGTWDTIWMKIIACEEKVGQYNLNRCQTNPPRDVISRCGSRCLGDALTPRVQQRDWAVTGRKQSCPALLCVFSKKWDFLPDNEPNTDWISRECSCPSGRSLAVQTRLYTLLPSPSLKWIPSFEITVSVAKTQYFPPGSLSDIAQSRG